jgi:hypothetical protein
MEKLERGSCSTILTDERTYPIFRQMPLGKIDQNVAIDGVEEIGDIRSQEICRPARGARTKMNVTAMATFSENDTKELND